MDEQRYLDFTTNPSNPFYIHPNKNLTLILVSPPLDRKSYLSWARSMKVELIPKNKLHFIDGTFQKSECNSNLHDPWVRCKNIVLSFISNAPSPITFHNQSYGSTMPRLFGIFCPIDFHKVIFFVSLTSKKILFIFNKVFSMFQHTSPISLPFGNKSTLTDLHEISLVLFLVLVAPSLIYASSVTKTRF